AAAGLNLDRCTARWPGGRIAGPGQHSEATLELARPKPVNEGGVGRSETGAVWFQIPHERELRHCLSRRRSPRTCRALSCKDNHPVLVAHLDERALFAQLPRTHARLATIITWSRCRVPAAHCV